MYNSIIIAKSIKHMTCKVWLIDIPSAVEQIAYNTDKQIRCNLDDDPDKQFHHGELLITFKVTTH